jgi:hypothetical protein
MTVIPQPQVEIDVEGPGLEIDAAEMGDVDAGIHDTLACAAERNRKVA